MLIFLLCCVSIRREEGGEFHAGGSTNTTDSISEWVERSKLERWVKEHNQRLRQAKTEASPSHSNSSSNSNKEKQFSLEAHEDDEDNEFTTQIEVNIPELTLQQLLSIEFDHEREQYQQQITDLKQEKDNSLSQFAQYRERARESLLKTANEQKLNEAKLEQLKEEVKVSPSSLPTCLCHKLSPSSLSVRQL